MESLHPFFFCFRNLRARQNALNNSNQNGLWYIFHILHLLREPQLCEFFKGPGEKFVAIYTGLFCEFPIF